MPNQVHDPRGREMATKPWKAKVDAIELQDRSIRRAFDQEFHVALHVGIPEAFVHVQMLMIPALLEVRPQLL